MSPQEKKNNSTNRAAVVFMLAAVIVFLWAFLSEKNKPITKKEVIRLTIDGSTTHEKRVNEFLKEIERRRQLTQDKTQVENYFTAPRIGSTVAIQPAQTELHPFKMKPEGLEDQVSRDLDFRNFERQQAASAEAVVQEQLTEQLRQQEYDKAYREAYVRDFIENARRNGYQVQVNDDLVVTSVVPIQGVRRNASDDEDVDFDDSAAQ